MTRFSSSTRWSSSRAGSAPKPRTAISSSNDAWAGSAVAAAEARPYAPNLSIGPYLSRSFEPTIEHVSEFGLESAREADLVADRTGVEPGAHTRSQRI